jgi:hypothetical protein
MGDRRGLPATVTIDHGRISIDAGEHTIGEWALDEVRLEPTGNGYRMAAEGEQILLEVHDSESFAVELRSTAGVKKRPRIRAPREKTPRPEENKFEAKPLRRKDKATEKPAKAEAEQVVATEEPARGLMGRIDSMIVAAERRWGSLLPAWVFTRRMVAGLATALVVTIIFPGIISSLLLIAGLVMVLGGAVVYTDQVMAAKWLPGRMTPMHVLLGGVTILMIGVLVGVAA